MRVALNVEQLLQPAPGGTGRYTAELAKGLPALGEGDTVVPFCAWHGRAAVAAALDSFGLNAPGVARDVVLPLPRPLLYDAWHVAGIGAPSRWSRAIAACDLVHAPSPAVPPTGGLPLVVSVHDAAFELFPETYPPRGLRFHRRGVAAAARRASLVITGTEAAAAEIAACTPIAAERLRVVPDGVDHVLASPDEVRATLERHGLADVRYVLWVGTIEPRKNLGTLVKAFARLVEGGIVPHCLVLVGPDGWQERGLVPEARALLGARLRPLGRVPDVDLRALYARADLFCLPSRHEGFGLPVLEAMVQGAPVLCADVPGLREVAGDAARIADPDDIDAWAATLAELLADDGQRQALSAAGRARAALFSWERTVRETRAVYEEVLGG